MAMKSGSGPRFLSFLVTDFHAHMIDLLDFIDIVCIYSK